MFRALTALRWFTPAFALVLAGANPGWAIELADLVEKIEPAVVQINTDRALGSGVVIDSSGIIITNYHVIEGAKTAKATFKSGKVVKILGYLAIDPKRDMAVLRLEKMADSLPAITFAKDLPRKGEKVAAFGNPKGFSFTTSEGIVSAIRSGKELSQMLGPEVYKILGYDESATWVQTTAAISGGNSGGPLVNTEGELIGLNTLTRPEAQNLNFAIAVADIKRVVEQAKDTPVQLANLPRQSNNISTPKKFKLAMPSGHVFSLDTFIIQLNDFRRPAKTDSQMLVLKHSNGALSAAAEQGADGVLDGRMLALSDSKEPLMYVSYKHGVRNGLFEAFDETGQPLVFTQYKLGKRQGFGCFFDGGKLRLILEYDRDTIKAVQLMADLSPTKTFDSLEAAEKDDVAGPMLKKLAKAEQTTRATEVDLKKQLAAESKEFRQLIRKGVRGR